MYRCQKTGKLSKQGESPYRLVTKKRLMKYSNYVKKKGRKMTIESEGWEIIEEILVCKEVYDEFGDA